MTQTSFHGSEGGSPAGNGLNACRTQWIKRRMQAERGVSFALDRATMTDSDFSQMSEFIHTVCGIKLLPAKKTMLEGRLRKRMRALGIGSFDAYCKYLMSTQGLEAEAVHMVDVVTTNKTDFFRESDHFEFLVGSALPELARSRKPGHTVKIWSAGCSSGEEPYTLAMVLNEYARAYPEFRFSLLATDISTRVLEAARQAIYHHDRIEPVPMALRKRYLLRSRDKSKKLVRIVPEVRSQVSFRRLNLKDPDYHIRESMDVIFCRNVLIYFDKEMQEKVLRQFCRHLHTGGFLFTGHSETIQGMNLPVVPATTTVYRRI